MDSGIPRALGGFGRANPFPPVPPRNFNVESPLYFFDDIAGTSGFTEPYTGFRYGMNGFPLD
jgi:hypothetical protein